MRRRLQDAVRLVGALFYWNTRKTVYVLRRRRGQCPCHHPSDSGRAGETVCEGAAAWADPRRFRRVCPLLVQDVRGRWVCGVDATEVRPFWGRVVGFSGGAVVGVALLAGLLVWGTMRGIGYQVTLRQVLWPRAWPELRQAQARLFVDRAQTALAQGRMKDALAALLQAQRTDPTNFEAGFTLARLSQSTAPENSWRLYQTLARAHPERRDEIAAAAAGMWLAHGRWSELAALATVELARNGAGEGGWLHALGVASRLRQQAEWLELAASGAARPEVRATLGLMVRVQQTPGALERYHLLTDSRPTPGCVYERIFRADELIRIDAVEEALALMQAPGAGLPGRDVARISLAAHARRGDRIWVRAQTSSLLSAERTVRAAEVEMLALHYLQWPEPSAPALLVAALDRLDNEPADQRLRAALAVCAVALRRGGDEAAASAAIGHLRAILGTRSGVVNRLVEVLQLRRNQNQLNMSVFCELPVCPQELLYILHENPN